MKNSNKVVIWLKLAILLFCVILILIGFAFGYIYNNYQSGACINRPISYGIEKLNEINNDDFTCSCSSKSGKFDPLYFDEAGRVRAILDTIYP